MLELQPVPCPLSLPIVVCHLTPIKDQLTLAREAIEDLRLQHPESTPSNVQALYMSPWKSQSMTTKLDPLISSVITISYEVSRNYFGVDLKALNLGLIATDCWGAIYESGHYANQHNHFPSDFACVIYLEAEENCAPIIFENHIKVQPTADMLIIFPGVLKHEVPPTDGKRVVVAMNLNKFPSFS